MNDDNVRPWYGRLTVWFLENVLPPVAAFVIAAVIALAAYREWLIWTR